LSAAKEPVRLGVIGTGFISAVHRQCAVRSARVDLVAVASARGRATRERVGQLDPSVRLLTIEELITAGDVEAVLVCTRTRDHADHAVAVLESGKHLLLEKPGAINLADHGRIHAAAAQHPQQVVRVAYHRRHDPAFREVAEVVRSGAIGAPFAVQLTSREDFPPSADDGPAGGFIMDVGAHDFDTARWLLQKDPDTAYTLAQNPVYRDDDLDNAHITVAHGGSVATIHLSRTSTLGMEIRCEVIGRDGSVVLAQGSTGSGVNVRSPAANPGFPADCRERFGDAYQAQMDDFGAACRGEQAPNASLQDDRWAVATAVAARASAERHEPLQVGSDWEWAQPSPDTG
jgi:myo-inositol 2-dehydrogenase / D-chiro-inositol 1-dehydrogenase